jgi:hypothetical protein
MTENQIKITDIMRKIHDELAADPQYGSTFKDFKDDTRGRLEELCKSCSISLESLMDEETGTYVVNKRDEEFWTYVLKNLTKGIFRKRRKNHKNQKLTYDEIIEEGKILEGIIEHAIKDEKAKNGVLFARRMLGYTVFEKIKLTNEIAQNTLNSVYEFVLACSGYTAEINKRLSGEMLEGLLKYSDAEALLDHYIKLLKKAQEFFIMATYSFIDFRQEEMENGTDEKTPEEILELVTKEQQQLLRQLLQQRDTSLI